MIEDRLIEVNFVTLPIRNDLQPQETVTSTMQRFIEHFTVFTIIWCVWCILYSAHCTCIAVHWSCYVFVHRIKCNDGKFHVLNNFITADQF